MQEVKAHLAELEELLAEPPDLLYFFLNGRPELFYDTVSTIRLST